MRRKRWHHSGRSRSPSVRNCKAVCRITAGRLLDPPKPYFRFFQIINAHRCRGSSRRSVLWPASSDSPGFGDGLGVSTCASCGGLEKCRCGRLSAVAVVLVLAFALAGTVAWIVTGQLLNMVDQFPSTKPTSMTRFNRLALLTVRDNSLLSSVTAFVAFLNRLSSIQSPQNRSQALGRARVPFPCASARYKKSSRKLAQSRNFGGQDA